MSEPANKAVKQLTVVLDKKTEAVNAYLILKKQ